MIRALNPRYFIYFKDKYKMKGLMDFGSKNEMNLWISMHGRNCSYMKVLSGFVLDERRNNENS